MLWYVDPPAEETSSRPKRATASGLSDYCSSRYLEHNHRAGNSVWTSHHLDPDTSALCVTLFYFYFTFIIIIYFLVAEQDPTQIVTKPGTPHLMSSCLLPELPRTIPSTAHGTATSFAN